MEAVRKCRQYLSNPWPHIVRVDALASRALADARFEPDRQNTIYRWSSEFNEFDLRAELVEGRKNISDAVTRPPFVEADPTIKSVAQKNSFLDQVAALADPAEGRVPLVAAVQLDEGGVDRAQMPKDAVDTLSPFSRIAWRSDAANVGAIPESRAQWALAQQECALTEEMVRFTRGKRNRDGRSRSAFMALSRLVRVREGWSVAVGQDASGGARAYRGARRAARGCHFGSPRSRSHGTGAAGALPAFHVLLACARCYGAACGV